MNIQQQYHYRPKWNTIVVSLIFFGACTVVISLKAYHNEEELIIGRLIHLSATAATTFFWLFAFTAALFVVAACLMIYLRAFHAKRITLTDDAILLPSGRLNQIEHHVPFSTITEVKQIDVISESFLYVHANGRRYTISKSMLSKQVAFEHIKATLEEQIQNQELSTQKVPI